MQDLIEWFTSNEVMRVLGLAFVLSAMAYVRVLEKRLEKAEKEKQQAESALIWVTGPEPRDTFDWMMRRPLSCEHEWKPSHLRGHRFYGERLGEPVTYRVCEKCGVYSYPT